MNSVLEGSEIKSFFKGAYFYDVHTKEFHYQGESALEIYLQIMAKTPNWVDRMMVLRNEIVSRVGIKNLGKLSNVQNIKPSDEYKVGEQLGIFSIYSLSQNEVILQDSDKHLDVKISLYLSDINVGSNVDNDSNSNSNSNNSKNTAKIHLTTVVHINNLFGKGYMFFVKPMHKLIVPAVLKTLSTSPT